MVDDTQYTDLITSEHADKPNYIAMVALTTQPFVDQQNVINAFSDDYDLDEAVGNQLDVCGLWIGISRRIKVPIVGFYFSFDIAGAGWDEAPWYSAGEATFNTVVLDEDEYRRVLKAKALANRWDGSLFGLYAIWDVFFSGTTSSIKIHDYQNMSMAYEIVGTIPDDATLAIIQLDYMNLRPEGVTLLQTIMP